MTVNQTWNVCNKATDIEACGQELRQLLVDQGLDQAVVDKITYHALGTLRMALDYGNGLEPTNTATLQVWANEQSVRLVVRGAGLSIDHSTVSSAEQAHRVTSLMGVMLLLTTLFKHVKRDPAGVLNLVYVRKDPDDKED